MVKTLERRLTHAHLPQDRWTTFYLVIEKVLILCLVVSTLTASAMFAILVFIRFYHVYIMQNFLLGQDNLKEMIRIWFDPEDEGAFLVPILRGEAKNEDTYFGEWMMIITSLGLSVAFTLLATILSGLLSVLEKNTVFVGVFILLNMTSIFMMIVFAVLLVQWDTPFRRGTSDDIKLGLRQEYKPIKSTSFVRLANSFMVAGECCGVDGPDDFPKSVISHPFHSHIELDLKFSPACCKTTTKSTLKENVQEVLACLEDTGPLANNSRLWQKGCYETWGKLFANDIYDKVLVVTILLGIVLIIQTIIGFVMMKIASFAMNPPGSRECSDFNLLSTHSSVARYPDGFPYWQMNSDDGSQKYPRHRQGKGSFAKTQSTEIF